MLKRNCICNIKKRNKERHASSEEHSVDLKKSVAKNRKTSQDSKKTIISTLKNKSKSSKKGFVDKSSSKTQIKKTSKINYQINKTPNGSITKDIIEQYCLHINLEKKYIDVLFDVVNAINDEYKYIILESKSKLSEMALTLANLYENSYILSSTNQLQDIFVKDYNFKNNDKFHISNHSDVFEEFKNFDKRKLLIIDDAHRLDENLANLFSLGINLIDFDTEFLSKFDYELKELENKSYEVWIDFIKYLSLDTDESKKIIDYIKNDPENWVCDYNDYYDIISFIPLNTGIFLKELMDKADFCVFLSPAILNFEKFIDEFNINDSQAKFIHYDSSLDLNKNKIFARNSVDMSNKKYFNENKILSIPIIREILNKHANDKGIIHVNSSLKTFIKNRCYGNSRIIIKRTGNDLKRFKESRNSILVTETLLESREIPKDCKFQIILKQHLDSWNKRSRCKDQESGWYDYRKAVNLVQQLNISLNDSFITYCVDESIFRFILMDINENKFIPEYILNSIVDRDYIDEGHISDNIKKKYGVYYMHDYIPDNRGIIRYQKYDSSTIKLSEDIQKYKDYQKDETENYIEEFNFFTKEFMKAICEFSNMIIDENINKLALVTVPSSTLERDEFATVRESIKCIENWFKKGKLQSVFKCKKEIINCNNLLNRCSDVDTSHLTKRRPSYGEHINSINCEKNNILKDENVAFIILDDISTRGTIMDACEDILIKNGVEQLNIYKFALFKTMWGYNDKT